MVLDDEVATSDYGWEMFEEVLAFLIISTGYRGQIIALSRHEVPLLLHVSHEVGDIDMTLAAVENAKLVASSHSQAVISHELSQKSLKPSPEKPRGYVVNLGTGLGGARAGSKSNRDGFQPCIRMS